jgi:hypothetical protein
MCETFRFKFSVEFAELLNNFSKIHEYDERKNYKEAWQKWTETNITQINKEIEYHEERGYNGNIMDKMYKSARYYYRKKRTVALKPAVRKEYEHIGKELLGKIDSFINLNLNMKPSEGFNLFYEMNIHTLSQRNIAINDENYKNIIKKTYKNRCYKINKRINAR